ncbi:MAG: polyribonucleotide nucleotidyltransferase [Victivallales bacterium]|nr:polyribonucleotide nucleotidyltransferase [Victivallales bacterium]
MSIENVTIDMGNGRPLTIETGKVALQANGAVMVRQGDTMVLVAVVQADPRPGTDFFPLSVEYRERFAAAGMIPGSYFKREGRPTEKEILTARMTDRPIRPMFPEGFINEVQVVSTVFSADGENEPDVLSIFGASAALMVSDIPFLAPVGACRVGRINGKFIANPTHSEMLESDIDLVYAGIAGKTIMIEGRSSEISEEELRDAMWFADGIVQKQIEAVKELAARVNKPKTNYKPHIPHADVMAVANAFVAGGKMEEACSSPSKLDRQAKQDALKEALQAELAAKFSNEKGELVDPTGEAIDFVSVWEILMEKAIRGLVLEKGIRQDGRAIDEVREISCEVGLLPRCHGSALFRRGETQALVTATLGSSGDVQEFDAITGGPKTKDFILHYNFPAFCTGETGRYGSTGRREIGHGALAERSVKGAMPKDYPYTVRVTSEILGSNGSSSMATVCGSSLALMDAGVPLSDAVVGISMGLVTGKDKRVFLTDIIGSEDHYGDMDFKVAATRKGITGFQLDLKIAGLDIEGMYEAMLKNRVAREHIRGIMMQCLPAPREKLNKYAPQMTSFRINPDKIGALIGPGGKNIRGITEATGAKIDVDDDGIVKIFASDGEAMEKASYMVHSCTDEVEVGKVYTGTVKTIKEFGAFVEILPGTDGMVHISELANYRVKSVDEICKVGDQMVVKVLNVDDRGRISLSRKAALNDEN